MKQNKKPQETDIGQVIAIEIFNEGLKTLDTQGSLIQFKLTVPKGAEKSGKIQKIFTEDFSQEFSLNQSYSYKNGSHGEKITIYQEYFNVHNIKKLSFEDVGENTFESTLSNFLLRYFKKYYLLLDSDSEIEVLIKTQDK